MTATRKQITDAVLARLVATDKFNLYGKRNRNPESLQPAQTPACFVVKHSETNARERLNLPNKRTLHLRIIIYTDAGGNENAVPMDVIDALLDVIDAAFAPDDPVSGRSTLGGLVYSAIVKGDTINAPGDVSGKGLAIIPLEVLIP